MKHSHWLPLATVFSCLQLFAYTTQITTDEQAKDKKTIHVHIALKPDEIIYKDTFKVSANTQGITLTSPQANKEASSYFDQATKETKEGYKNDVTFTFDAIKKDLSQTGKSIVHTSFALNTSAEPQEKLIDLNFASPEQTDPTNANAITTHRPIQPASSFSEQPSFISNIVQKTITQISDVVKLWKNKLSNLFETTGSGWLRLLVAFILGVLLSLTPCIYPMIPITVGVLQANTGKSVIKNFLVALAYTFGISCTFALLGFVTALTSSVFGELQSKAWIIVPFAMLLAYLGFAMFGLYELYIPKFLRPKSTQVKGGSFVSAFIFGAISGTIASPCLSPGLALILAYVAKITQAATVASYFNGFLTLFIFGVGSSLPLLIIGTFSNSITLLPKAGAWMVEVKRMLGLMLLGTAFYQLEKVIPWYILVWGVVLFLFAVGIYYFADRKPYDSSGFRRYKQIIGTLFVIASCLMVVQGIKAFYTRHESASSLWLTDYALAKTKAQEEHKKLLLSFKTAYCAACKVLDNSVFVDASVIEAMKHYILVKIDGTDASSEPFATLKTAFGIKGFPTVVIVDPQTGALLKKWEGDVGPVDIFLQELAKNQ